MPRENMDQLRRQIADLRSEAKEASELAAIELARAEQMLDLERRENERLKAVIDSVRAILEQVR